jgi:hypothetical protein
MSCGENLSDDFRAIPGRAGGLGYVRTYPVGYTGIALWTYDPSADRWASVDVTGLPTDSEVEFVWAGRDLLAIGRVAAAMGGFRYTP